MYVDMSNYKVIHKNRIYKCLSLMYIECHNAITREQCINLKVIYIDENNRIQKIEDNKDNFQFVINN